MLKKLSVILTALCLSACSQNVELSKPAPQKMKVQTVDKKSQKGLTTVYLCKDNKEVSVVHTKQKQKSKKTLSQVTVTYNDVTEKLTRVISERGRNYANIRWYWQERDDFSRLQTSVGEVLAERCVKKTNKLKQANNSFMDLQRGFVLHRRPYSETSLLVDLFTEETGRLTVIAKGARAKRSAWKSVLQPFTPLLLRWSGKGALKTLTKAEPAAITLPLQQTALYSGFYVNELITRVIEPETANPQLFSIIYNA